MAIIQPVENGKIVSDTNDTKAQSKNGSTLDKQAFLQLLVAQMKYQDPLEPTDNTEYVAQLATFSQLEETQNQTKAIEQQEANDLVGKQVIMKVTSATTGETTYTTGKVDYVYVNGNDISLSVNDQLFSLEDLDSVVDGEYLDAVNLADKFSAAMELLPTVGQCRLTDKTAIENVQKIYNSMSAYQQQYVAKEDLDKLQALIKKIAELENAPKS